MFILVHTNVYVFLSLLLQSFVSAYMFYYYFILIIIIILTHINCIYEPLLILFYDII